MHTAQAAGQPIEILGIRVPPGSEERRNPVVLIDLAIYDLKVTYAVVALKGRKLACRPPETPERTSGVRLPEYLELAVYEATWAAVAADAAAWAVLTRRPSARAC